MVILLLYGCGLRTGELSHLDVSDVNIEREEILVRHGKGDRDRVLPVAGGVWTELMAYLADRGGKRGPLFLTTAKRRRINDAEIGTIVRDASHRAGIERRVTPKTLRHTFATHLMQKGVGLAVISSLMGHRSLSETGVYLHALPGQGRKAVNRLTRGDDK
jgi:integrase/recombinase XerD